MAEHGERLQEIRKRIVQSRRKLLAEMTKSASDAQGLWADLLKIDGILQAVDRAIKDEGGLEPV